jgi:hypothetical protein
MPVYYIYIGDRSSGSPSDLFALPVQCTHPRRRSILELVHAFLLSWVQTSISPTACTGTGSTGYTERRKTKRKVKKLLCSLRWRRVEPKKTTAKTWTSFNLFLLYTLLRLLMNDNIEMR